MKLLFLGSGSAFTLGNENFQSNMLLISDSGEKLLLDCGTDIRFSLQASGLSYQDITNVYISHLHADHVGGLEWLAFCRKMVCGGPRPKLYLSENLVQELWEHSLMAGLNTIDGKDVNIDYYFDVKRINNKLKFQWAQIDFQLIATPHVKRANHYLPSYGLFFTCNHKKIFITTDTRFDPDQFNALYQQADVIFHDCETSVKPSGVHAHYDELKTLGNKIKSKMWLYHYNPGSQQNTSKDHFLGFVKRGQTFEF